MRRWLFAILSGLSLMLCALSCFLWLSGKGFGIVFKSSGSPMYVVSYLLFDRSQTGIVWDAGSGNETHSTIATPLFAGLMALPPILWIVRIRSARRTERRRAGKCLNCGYDLRATPDV